MTLRPLRAFSGKTEIVFHPQGVAFELALKEYSDQPSTAGNQHFFKNCASNKY
jgi:hypothetical protein